MVSWLQKSRRKLQYTSRKMMATVLCFFFWQKGCLVDFMDNSYSRRVLWNAQQVEWERAIRRIDDAGNCRSSGVILLHDNTRVLIYRCRNRGENRRLSFWKLFNRTVPRLCTQWLFSPFPHLKRRLGGRRFENDKELAQNSSQAESFYAEAVEEAGATVRKMLRSERWLCGEVK